MNFKPNETQQAIRETARQFARERIAPVADRLAAEERFPTELVAECAGLGLLGVNVPERFGGSGAGAVATALVIHEIARADAAFAVTVAVTNMVAEVIHAFGTEAQRQRFLPRITSGEAGCASFALSEAESASDAASLRTLATARGEGYVLDGQKVWISHGDRAGVIVVWARTDPAQKGAGGVSAFIVEGGTPGLRAGPPADKMGLRASPTVPLAFEDCAVPAENLLGAPGEGFKIAMMALDGGRINIAGQATGVARAALEASVRYAKQRTAFGKTIFEFQAIKWFVADMITQVNAAELMMLRAAYLKERGEPFTLEASMAKLFSSEMAQRVVDKAVEIHGGYGYLGEFPVERLFRDARVQTIYEGTSEIQRMVIARKLLEA